MVIRHEEIGTRVKYWARPDIVNRIEEGSIRAYFNASLKAIPKHEVDIETPEGLITLANDYVVAATGYQPNLEFLKKLGVQITDDGYCHPCTTPKRRNPTCPGSTSPA